MYVYVYIYMYVYVYMHRSHEGSLLKGYLALQLLRMLANAEAPHERAGLKLVLHRPPTFETFVSERMWLEDSLAGQRVGPATNLGLPGAKQHGGAHVLLSRVDPGTGTASGEEE